jgi:hypothetical protein
MWSALVRVEPSLTLRDVEELRAVWALLVLAKRGVA